MVQLRNTMIYMIWFLFFLSSSHGQAIYDGTPCSEDGNTPAGPGADTRYTCTNTALTKVSCQTFLIFRANHRFATIAAISALFGSPIDTLLELNHVDLASEFLFVDREVLVPVSCSCSGGFFQARINYTVPDQNMTFSDVACGVFEGLVKAVTLLEENRNQEDVIKVGFGLNVPLKCACPNNRYKYLVTYPLVSGDSIIEVSTKFGVSKDDILRVNGLHPDTTVYPETTILVPSRSKPTINFDVLNIQPPTPGFLLTKPVEGNVKPTKLKKVFIAVSIIGFGLVLVILIVTGLYVKALNKCKRDIFVVPLTHRISSFTSSSTPRVSSPRSRLSPDPVMRNSPVSCLSPDFLAGIKYSLYNFTIKEIKRATRDFSKDCKVSENTYRGWFDDVQVLIKEIEFSEIQDVIDLYSKINHVNIVKLIGVCYNECSWSYLVLEYPAFGSLKECLASSSSLTWQRRTQIAFDVAMGLHYLHYCIVPPYKHAGLDSGNIFVTSKWRAKLAVLPGNTSPGSVGSRYDNLDAVKANEKEDILEYGIVLIEILSGNVKMERKALRDSIGFLGGEGGDRERGCFEELRGFMDPCLKEDYPLAEALCLGVLAKSCVEGEPLHRPSLEDILKVLARIL